MEINTSVTDQVFGMCKCQQPSAGGLQVRIGLILPVQFHLISVQTCPQPPLSGHAWHISTHLLDMASIARVYSPLSATAMSLLRFSTVFPQHEVLKACSLGAALLFFQELNPKGSVSAVDETPKLSRPLWPDIISLDCL